MIATAVFVTMINISVFNVWIPARLQINHTYHVVNEYWDRVEKFLYLFVDAALNRYFLKTVRANLISNGLTKYNRLVTFNQRIVVISLLMDVMIIAAMSIPNSFVYVSLFSSLTKVTYQRLPGTFNSTPLPTLSSSTLK